MVIGGQQSTRNVGNLKDESLGEMFSSSNSKFDQ